MFKKFLVATDGSTLAEESARGAIALAKAAGAGIVGFYAAPTYHLPIYNDMTNAPVISPESHFIKHSEEVARQTLRALESMAAAAGVKFAGRTAASDQPALAIIEAAKNEQCDLICMGSHGLGNVAQMLLGSVATKVLSLCEIPVLLHRARKSA
ncbi:MAG: universal stress protein [Betaproteobacteria bacterium]